MDGRVGGGDHREKAESVDSGLAERAALLQPPRARPGQSPALAKLDPLVSCSTNLWSGAAEDLPLPERSMAITVHINFRFDAPTTGDRLREFKVRVPCHVLWESILSSYPGGKGRSSCDSRPEESLPEHNKPRLLRRSRAGGPPAVRGYRRRRPWQVPRRDDTRALGSVHRWVRSVVPRDGQGRVREAGARVAGGDFGPAATQETGGLSSATRTDHTNAVPIPHLITPE